MSSSFTRTGATRLLPILSAWHGRTVKDLALELNRSAKGIRSILMQLRDEGRVYFMVKKGGGYNGAAVRMWYLVPKGLPPPIYEGDEGWESRVLAECWNNYSYIDWR